MKKKIEIEIPKRIGIEGETKSIREEMIERKLQAITRAIVKRTKIQMPEKAAFKLDEKSTGKDKPAKKVLNVELDLTQKQIDALPVGLKKMLV